MTIFIGNLNRSVREEELHSLFAAFGEVTKIKLMKDQYTGESKGFAFIDMMNDSDAKHAISKLDKREFAGRTVTVNQAKRKGEESKQGMNRHRDRNNYVTFK